MKPVKGGTAQSANSMSDNLQICDGTINAKQLITLKKKKEGLVYLIKAPNSILPLLRMAL